MRKNIEDSFDKIMNDYLKEADRLSSDEKIIRLYELEVLRDEKMKVVKEIAKSMLENGIDIDIIVKCTNLSKEEIETL